MFEHRISGENPWKRSELFFPKIYEGHLRIWFSKKNSNLSHACVPSNSILLSRPRILAYSRMQYFHVREFRLLKGHGNETYFSIFVYKSVCQWSLTQQLMPFWFCVPVRWDLCNRILTPRFQCYGKSPLCVSRIGVSPTPHIGDSTSC